MSVPHYSVISAKSSVAFNDFMPCEWYLNKFRPKVDKGRDRILCSFSFLLSLARRFSLRRRRGGEERETAGAPWGGGYRGTRGWAEKGKKNKSFVRARSENRMVQTVEKLFLPFLSGLI